MRAAIELLSDEPSGAGRLAGARTRRECILIDSALIPRTECRGAAAPRTRDATVIADAVARVETRLSHDSSARALHAAGLVALYRARGSPGEISVATRRLEAAHRRDPRQVPILNDLAVAYLRTAERDQSLGALLRALDFAERAFERDSTSAPVLFNRALIHQRLYLTASAGTAWRGYGSAEPKAEWRDEAVRQAAQIDSPAAPDRGLSRQAARDSALVLLHHWGKAIVARDSRAAASWLLQARAIVQNTDSSGGDQTIVHALRAIDAANDGTRSRLAKAHAAYGDGVSFLARAAYDDAAAAFTTATKLFRETGSRLAGWADVYHAGAEVSLGEYARADDRLRPVALEDAAEVPALTGKAVWIRGVAQLRRGSYDVANRYYRAATRYFIRAGETENVGATSYLLTEGLLFEGQTAAAHAEGLLGLKRLVPFRRSPYLNNHLTTVAALARADSLPFAARAVMREVLAVARTLDRPQVMAFALRALARDQIALGRTGDANAALDSASQWAKQIRAGKGRDRVVADIRLVRGQLLRPVDALAAADSFRGAAEVYRKLESNGHLVTALSQAAQAAEEAGDSVRARAHLAEAVSTIEQQSATFESADSRASLVEATESVFDRMINIEVASGHTDAAYVLLQRARNAVWRLSTSGVDMQRDTQPLSRLGARLASDELLVEYAILPRRLLIWAASNQSTRFHDVAIRRDSLAALVEAYVEELGNPQTDTTSARARLFEHLVRPLSRELSDKHVVFVVGDRELGRLSFAALWNRTTRQFLIETHEIRALPTASWIAARVRTDSATKRSNATLHALIAGTPDGGAAGSGIPVLQGAADETRRIGAIYSKRRMVSGAEATRQRLMELLPQADLFHFAGHAVTNDAQPELSFLAVAPTAGDDGTLPAWEIGRLRLSNLKLVVLAACRSLTPRPSHAGPIAGLAYSFVRAGASAAISSLWDVNDETTADLLTDFHAQFAAGVHPATALRESQLRSLRSGGALRGAPRAWAAFVYTGT
jgi:CHAT domain-containing protein